MSIKERREREKLALREAILGAAREIAAVEGWSGVSIRKIADRIEYSPPMIYEHFDDKESLLTTLLLDGFRQLTLDLQAARTANPDPEAALMAMTTAYWRFAQENPELYEVMNGLDGVCFRDIEKVSKPDELKAIAEEVLGAITAWGQAKGVIFADLEDQFHILWGVMHGLVALGMAGRINGDAKRGEVEYIHQLLQQALRTMLSGWRNQHSV